MKRACLYQRKMTMSKFLCELERSGNPRSEFHTVGERLKSIAVNTKVVINVL
jgi:hypothetical protein